MTEDEPTRAARAPLNSWQRLSVGLVLLFSGKAGNPDDRDCGNLWECFDSVATQPV